MRFNQFGTDDNTAEDTQKLYMVPFIGNFYDGKYYAQGIDSILVKASSPEEAKQLAGDNMEAVLDHFKHKRYRKGKGSISAIKRDDTYLKLGGGPAKETNQRVYRKALTSNGVFEPVNLDEQTVTEDNAGNRVWKGPDKEGRSLTQFKTVITFNSREEWVKFYNANISKMIELGFPAPKGNTNPIDPRSNKPANAPTRASNGVFIDNADGQWKLKVPVKGTVTAGDEGKVVSDPAMTRTRTSRAMQTSTNQRFIRASDGVTVPADFDDVSIKN